MRVLVACAVLVLVALASAEPWSQTVELKNAVDGYMHADVQEMPVLQSGITLTITPSQSSCKFDVCWTWLVRAPNENDEEWQKMCQYLYRDWDSKAGPLHTQKVNPGVGHLNLYTTQVGCTATVQLAGNSCDDGGYGPGCTGLFDTPFEDLTVEPGSYLYFNASANNRWFNNRLSVTITEKDGKTFDFYYREGDAPRVATTMDPSVYDMGGTFTGVGTLTLENPRNLGHTHESIFQKVFAVRNPNNDRISISFSQNETSCERWLYGSKCKYRAPPLVGEYAYQLPNSEKEWIYGSIILTDAEENPEEFTMGVTTLEGQEAPAMYLRYAAIPDSETYDMKIGKVTTNTRFYQSGVTLTRAGRWFWAAHIARSAQKGAFGLWFNTDCPNSCSMHGECVDNRCECDSSHATDWYTCALEGEGTTQPAVSVSDMDDSDGGMGGDEIFFIVMVSLETFLLVILALAAAVFAYSRYAPKGAIDQDYEEL
eukprot:TRINITY_DN3105_c0_g1_i1.p1 TRINITY_DN3105_c0_g1~~TRINITY_DN3105_c0_g1_i1.p1  ORF type:complete len:494 (+),score=126.40 TRINITY_DN3105_c0_g1_i1:34-1482(+)